MADPRWVVGNPVWAKAMQVSKDCRRIYGADVDKLWLHGTVLEIITQRKENARRATTLVKASYVVGNGERVKIINISQLKKDDPNSTPEVILPPPPAINPQAEGLSFPELPSTDNNTTPTQPS
jgi:hypothetical protein